MSMDRNTLSPEKVLQTNFGFNYDGKPYVVKNKGTTGYLKLINADDPNEGKYWTIDYSEPLKHTSLIVTKKDDGEIAQITAKIDCLPRPLKHYVCSDVTHRDSPHENCASCKDAKKAKDEEQGFKFIEGVEKIDQVAKDFLDLKNIPANQFKKAETLRNKILSEMGKAEIIKEKEISKQVFKSTIEYPRYSTKDMEYDTSITEDMIGQINYDKSPIFTARIWETKQKTGVNDAEDQKKQMETRNIKQKVNSVENPAIYMGETGAKIYTIVHDCTNQSYMPRQIKTWTEFDDFLLYEAGDAKAGKRNEFNLVSIMDFLLPMLVFSDTKGIKYRWTIKSMKVGKKIPLVRKKQLTQSEAQNIHLKFNKFDEKLPEEDRQEAQVTEYIEQEGEEEKSDELSEESKKQRKRKLEEGEEPPSKVQKT